jgi:hypothetical protein
METIMTPEELNVRVVELMQAYAGRLAAKSHSTNWENLSEMERLREQVGHYRLIVCEYQELIRDYQTLITYMTAPTGVLTRPQGGK